MGCLYLSYFVSLLLDISLL